MSKRNSETGSPTACGREQLIQLQGGPASLHYRRPPENALSAEEKGRTTLLFGGLTWRHEKLVQAVFEAAGHRCEHLPNPDLEAFRIGKEYCNNGDCNPVYFTIGSLIQYLRRLREKGLSKEEIIDRYVLFTAGSCGPCRFGTYESEYRFALRNAGFEAFRVLVFQQQKGVRQPGEAGLQYTMDFGMGILNALNLGDVLSGLLFQIRPYEVKAGETDRIIAECIQELATFLRERAPFEILESSPSWLARSMRRHDRLTRFFNNLGKFRKHLYEEEYRTVLENTRRRINQIEVDRTRVRPMIKITGEFWGQLTESDGNYNMFSFLEEEGAQVLVDPLAEWVRYLLYQAKRNLTNRRAVDCPNPEARIWQLGSQLANWRAFQKPWLLLSLAERVFSWQFNRITRHFGGLVHHLVPQADLAKLAHPFYNSLARGGEGHLEVGKNIYYTIHHRCHAVLSLKPFGCMPSTQSDAVQATVTERFPEMIFLPVETSGDGEIHALSRVQMALREAAIKAREEFERVLHGTGRSLQEIRGFVQDHPVLRRPFYPVPAEPGVAGLGARFVKHVGDLMDGRVHLKRA